MTATLATDWRLDVRACEMYYLALADRRVTVEVTPRFGADTFPDSEYTLRLPADPPTQPGLRRRDWYQVALAHRALHHELGTFRFSLDQAGPRARTGLPTPADGRSDLELLLSGFADRNLAVRLFQILEALRIDAMMPRIYPGLAEPLDAVLRAAAALRPALGSCAPRMAAVEFLVRCSLGRQPSAVPLPIAPASAALERICRPLALRSATVAQTVLATGLAYGVVVRLPNLGVLAGLPDVALADAEPVPVDWPQPWPEPAREAIEGDAILDVVVPAVPHRDDLTHRLWRSPQPPAPSEQAVYKWRADAVADDANQQSATAIEVSGPPQPLPHEHFDFSRDLHHHEHGSLDREGPRTFVYPEWDVVQRAIRPRWCRVIEDTAGQADPTAVHDLQHHHQFLVARLRRLMQSAAPRALDIERRAVDGDDVDFDAAVDALVDIRLGRSPGDGVYQRLVPHRRDVAVGIVVDASASTGERLAGVPPLAPRSGPVGYRDHPRVLDLEILAAVLCLSAIDAVGDHSVAWAFSGTGRESVRMAVIKTLRESFGGPALRRAAAVRPGHATRTGAAIRHAAAVLGAAPHATRLLFVLTDGLPYDIDYGQQHGDERAAEYALADTARAVSDARCAGIRPVLLTVAAPGEPVPLTDAVSEVEVLPDITRLPERLTSLYRDLATNLQPAVQRTAVNQ
ncbi:MAG: hypothetical protein J2P28_12330 [Actinobacteria bacterium]|nr:hypothetical protein [Actinomycetota bacterium]